MITLHIGNIPWEMLEEDLNKELSSYGKILSISLIKNWTKNQSRGFAFVSVETEQGARDIIENLNGVIFMECPLKIEISKRSRHEPFVKEPRQETLESSDLDFFSDREKFGFLKKRPK